MVDYSRYQALKVEKAGGIITVTMNRPQTLNAFDLDLHRELEDIWEDVARDKEVRCAVLTGAGRAFSAGGDIRGMQLRLTDPSTPRLTLDSAKRLIMNMLNVEQPIIAAVNGDAVGLGATVALFCDVIIAAENARIGDPHVRVGIVAGDGGCIIWPLLIGLAKAKEFLMTGDLIPAPEAERIGLINRVAPADKVLSTAMEMARRLANGPTKAIQWTKHSINKVLRERANLILDTSLGLEFLTMAMDDHREAVAAFLEKRSPVFKGT